MTTLILFLITMAVSAWASHRVRSQFNRWNQVPVWSRLSGADAARRILREAGIHDVEVTAVAGALTDHYDPRHKVLALSEPVFAGRSVAALGVAAHEAGHAIQHARGYAPLQWRMAAVRATTTASWLLMLAPIMLGLMGHLFLGLTVAVVCLGILMIFNLVTLPVEFDASRRAKEILAGSGMVAPGDESRGVSAVLNAAGLTYVAAFLSSLAWFLLRLVELTGLQGREE
jgi:Zn-dependent membrane protease YugP